MTEKEIQTLAGNAFRFLGLASRYEEFIGKQILTLSVSDNEKDRVPRTLYTTFERSYTERSSLSVAGAISGGPVTTSELHEMLPNQTPEEIRLELIRLIESGLVYRISKGCRITYLRC